MGRRLELEGRVFGRLTVVAVDGRDQWGKLRWSCLCECGGKKIALRGDLVSGHTQSCGCLQKARTVGANTVHGLARRATQHPLYNTWEKMRQRCNNPNSGDFKNYGGRGISVCSRWDWFPNFLADMGDRPESYTLDRIDPDGDYTPENCRWATALQQRHNRSVTKLKEKT